MDNSLRRLSPLLKSAVGTPGKAGNFQRDVIIVQYLFNLIKPIIQYDIPEDGIISPTLIRTISQFQSIHLRFQHPDGVIEPEGKTFRGLVAAAMKYPLASQQSSFTSSFFRQPSANENSVRQLVNDYLRKERYNVADETLERSKLMAPGIDGAVSLTEQDFTEAWENLNRRVELNIIKAFSIVESGGRSGFNALNLPIIAYEGHIFRKYTKRKYDQTHPFLSYKYVKKAGPEWQKNNIDQLSAWNTLAKAYALDAEAAIKSCSWGMFQIMGFNYESCGYKDLGTFLKDMKSNAGKQLNAFLHLCNKNSSLLSAMVNKDFYNMAFNYNGSDFGDYDVKIRRTYESLEKRRR
ncbi:N-acetylmuramidase family protein [Enterobacter roggenkampii]|uniref:N-acetylmuramidase family protein n=1 Tax=Enterobacter roggenkampii TaxID=1812935 RepID=UPI0020755BBB|nr:N-acetylmuramidase family protein [Enterobacter roggenkampii]MCM7723776.1 N-acetylmuramidase family protein [Enterobacter roggenkampii]